MPGDPHSGSKVWKAPDREIGKPGENRGKVIAHRDLQPTAAFHDRENRRNLRSRLWAADVQLAAAILDRILERGRFIHLDGPSWRTRHLNLEEALPAAAERARISGTTPKFLT